MVERRPRVLMTLADVAWPVDAGKRLRAVSMVRAVAAHCDLEALVLFPDADPHLRALPPDVAGGCTVVPAQPRPMWRTALDAAATRSPWQTAVHDWAAVRALVGGREGRYDLVWFGALDHFHRLRRSVDPVPMVVDCDDVETVKLRAFLGMAGSALPRLDRVQRRVELPLWAGIQRRAVRQAGAVLVCSDLDRQRLADEVRPVHVPPGRIVSVPNTYPEPTDTRPPAPQGQCTVVMIANFGTDQNVDAATYAARDVLPALLRAVPGAQLRLVGRRPDRLVHLAAISGLQVVGPVPSVAAELAGAHAVLVPIRFGGGTRLKIVEAFAYGVPVVTTTAGAEGIDVRDGRELLLADDPSTTVAAIGRVLDEAGLADALIAAGRLLYQRGYSPASTAAAVERVLAAVGV